MTQGGKGPAPEDTVSRVRFERERTARRDAESLLEIKSREIYEANAALRAETEALRSALARLEDARESETRARRESAVLFAAVDAMAGTRSGTVALQELLGAVRAGLAVDDAVVLRGQDGGLRAIAATDPALVGRSFPQAAAGLRAPFRVTGDGAGAGGCLIAVPLRIPEEGHLAMACLARDESRLGAEELHILARVAEVAVAPLETARLMRRNALLAALVEGAPVATQGEEIFDAPLKAVSRAFDHLTTAQAQVVRAVGDVLSAPPDGSKAAVLQAFAAIGSILGLDLVALVERVPDAPAQTVCQWQAEGMAQDEAVAALARDRALTLTRAEAARTDPQLAADMAAAGVEGLVSWPVRIAGGRPCTVIGCTFGRPLAVSARFLPLFRSVAVAVASVVAQRSVVEALDEERRRLQATLGAMPDLLLEIDRDGVFRDFHSGGIPVSDAVHHAVRYQRMEDVLPPDLAAVGRRLMAAVDMGERPPPHTIPFDLGDGERLFDVTGTRMGETGYLFVMRDVTKARRQQAEIERLSEVARRTTNLVIVTDAEQRIEWANPAFEALTGYSLSKAIGQRPGDLLQGPRTDKEEARRIGKALAARQAVSGELLNYSRTGREYWVQVDIQPLMTPGGALRGFMAVETDVTERRQQEERLRATSAEAVAARRLLETAVESLEDAFVIYDAEDHLVMCNERYRAMYPLAAPAIVPGARFEDIVRYAAAHGQYAEAVGHEDAWVAQQLADRRTKHANNVFELKLGDGRWLRVIDKATPDGGRVGLRIDITALKLAEERAVADRAEAMDASRDGIALLDAQRRVVYANAAFRLAFGIDADADVTELPWQGFFRPAIADWVMSEVLPAMQAEGSWQGEIEGLSRDGGIVDQELTLTLRADGGILVISRDVSQRRVEAAERARLDEDLRLAQRREAMAHIAAGLAHDFNNLLATISGNAALIEDELPAGILAAQGVQRILQASEQAAALVRRLLALGAQTRAPRRFDLRDPVREATDLARASIRVPTRLTVELPETPCPTEADPTDVMQIVLNLVINARDALVSGDGTIDVSLGPAGAEDLQGPFAVGSVDPARGYYRLAVQDSGEGMPDAVASQVFRPYFTTKGTGGTGLGLAVVSSVVLTLGGAVKLSTGAGQGTRFVVLWPDRAAPATGPVAAPADEGGAMRRLDGRAILVVDDDATVLSVHARMLEQAGAEVAPTTDPADVLEAVSEDPGAWDAVLTDFDMPGMDGAALAARIAEIAPGLPVVLVTALTDWRGRAKDGGDPFAAVIGKPATRTALVNTMAAAIG